VTDRRDVYDLDGQSGFMSLSEEQQQIAIAAAKPALFYSRPVSADGGNPPDDPRSSVLLAGDSYSRVFRELLVRDVNMLVRTRWAPNQTTEMFADFLREPESLEGVRVVVWVTTEHRMLHFKPLPPAVQAALQDGK
jgi:hypothetical protein